MILPDTVDLHRLTWHPDDYDEIGLKSSAFASADLKGGSRYISVHRMDTATRTLIKLVADNQQRRANPPDTTRTSPMSVLLGCEKVRNALNTENEIAFCVSAEPLPKDVSHCGIRNKTKKKTRSYIDELRTLLMVAVINLLPFDEMFPE